VQRLTSGLDAHRDRVLVVARHGTLASAAAHGAAGEAKVGQVASVADDSGQEEPPVLARAVYRERARSGSALDHHHLDASRGADPPRAEPTRQAHE
jgi:hypothetical protein